MAESTPLTTEENGIFNDEWDAFVTRHFKSREVNDIFMDNREAILEACEIAKYELESGFGGVNAAPNQFGWMPIQPAMLLASGTPTYATSTWNRYITTSNVTTAPFYSDWVGTSDGSLNTSKYSTLVLLGFENPAEIPKVGGVLAEIKAKKYYGCDDAYPTNRGILQRQGQYNHNNRNQHYYCGCEPYCLS